MYQVFGEKLFWTHFLFVTLKMFLVVCVCVCCCCCLVTTQFSDCFSLTICAKIDTVSLKYTCCYGTFVAKSMYMWMSIKKSKIPNMKRYYLVLNSKNYCRHSFCV